MQLARAVAAQALAEAQGEPGAEPGRADPGLSFSRVARAVRLTLALEARIREGVAARAAPETGGFDYMRRRPSGCVTSSGGCCSTTARPRRGG